MTKHPLTPPPELVQQWVDNWYSAKIKHDELIAFIATQAARWGADQELEACCEWLGREVNSGWGLGAQLLAARRPKPPSLKAQALTVLDDASDRLDAAHENIIRRALESLPS